MEDVRDAVRLGGVVRVSAVSGSGAVLPVRTGLVVEVSEGGFTLALGDARLGRVPVASRWAVSFGRVVWVESV